MQYNLSSNDYYAALNRRFDDRLRKLRRYNLLGKDCGGYATSFEASRVIKPVVCRVALMNMSNRCYYERMGRYLIEAVERSVQGKLAKLAEQKQAYQHNATT